MTKLFIFLSFALLIAIFPMEIRLFQSLKHQEQLLRILHLITLPPYIEFIVLLQREFQSIVKYVKLMKSIRRLLWNTCTPRIVAKLSSFWTGFWRILIHAQNLDLGKTNGVKQIHNWILFSTTFFDASHLLYPEILPEIIEWGPL